MASLIDQWLGRERPPSGSPVYSGDYPDWPSAAAVCRDGYAARDILAHVRLAALQVKRGAARYERDGVALHDNRLPWEVLAGLLRAAAVHHGVLRVLDIGGSLGSTYFPCRAFLSAVAVECWCIVEQPIFVEAGRAEFQDEVLCFDEDLDAGCAACRPTVALLSSVLQYLEHPHAFLDRLVALGVGHIIIDRTQCWTPGLGRDRLTVQQVPPSIYPARYPSWFFDEPALLAHFAPAYRLVAAFDSWESWTVDGTEVRNRGFIFEWAGSQR